MNQETVKNAVVTAVDTLAKFGNKITPGKPTLIQPAPKAIKQQK